MVNSRFEELCAFSPVGLADFPTASSANSTAEAICTAIDRWSTCQRIRTHYFKLPCPWHSYQEVEAVAVEIEEDSVAVVEELREEAEVSNAPEPFVYATSGIVLEDNLFGTDAAGPIFSSVD